MGELYWVICTIASIEKSVSCGRYLSCWGHNITPNILLLLLSSTGKFLAGNPTRTHIYTTNSTLFVSWHSNYYYCVRNITQCITLDTGLFRMITFFCVSIVAVPHWVFTLSSNNSPNNRKQLASMYYLCELNPWLSDMVSYTIVFGHFNWYKAKIVRILEK
jgi:hypothetical protein